MQSPFIPIECGLHCIPYLIPDWDTLGNFTIYCQCLRTVLSTGNTETVPVPIWNKEILPKARANRGLSEADLGTTWEIVAQFGSSSRYSDAELAGKPSVGLAVAKGSFFVHCFNWALTEGQDLSDLEFVVCTLSWIQTLEEKYVTALSVWRGKLSATSNVTCPWGTFIQGKLAHVKTSQSFLGLGQSFQNGGAGKKEKRGLSWGNKHKEERSVGVRGKRDVEKGSPWRAHLKLHLKGGLNTGKVQAETP